jgi:hypothetical protein
MSYSDRIPSILDEYQPNQTQVEALIDTLTLAMVAEGEVPDHEREELERTLEQLDWRGTRSIHDYVDDSIAADRDVVESGEVRSRVEDISERLDDDALREEAYFLAARVAAIDAEVVSDETDVLTTLVDVFDIPRDRLKLLTRKLRNQI